MACRRQLSRCTCSGMASYCRPHLQPSSGCTPAGSSSTLERQRTPRLATCTSQMTQRRQRGGPSARAMCTMCRQRWGGGGPRARVGSGRPLFLRLHAASMHAVRSCVIHVVFIAGTAAHLPAPPGLTIGRHATEMQVVSSREGSSCKRGCCHRASVPCGATCPCVGPLPFLAGRGGGQR